MNRIVIFGKPAGGKSTLSKKLSDKTGINLYPLDLIEYYKNGERVEKQAYLQKHNELINKDSWIIEGLGTLDSFWLRIDAADTLVYIDLPYRISYWWSVKRLLISVFKKPLGWPEDSSVFKGTIASFKYLHLSRHFWTEELFEKIESRSKDKKLYRITSVEELNSFA